MFLVYIHVSGAYIRVSSAYVRVSSAYIRVWSVSILPATHCNTLQHTATHCNTLQHCLIRIYSTRGSGCIYVSRLRIYVSHPYIYVSHQHIQVSHLRYIHVSLLYIHVSLLYIYVSHLHKPHHKLLEGRFSTPWPSFGFIFTIISNKTGFLNEYQTTPQVLAARSFLVAGVDTRSVPERF